MQTVCFKTLGCKVNQYETQAIREGLLGVGFVEKKDFADVYVINTCTVTEKSDNESKELVRKALKRNPRAFVVVTGCYAEKDGGELSRIGGVGAVVPNSRKASITSILAGEGKAPEFSISDFEGHTKAFVKIQDGCDRFCSFCKVPFVRGRSRSRPLEEVIEEARRLVGKGFKEIVLSGICLGDYGRDFKDKPGLIALLDGLEEIDSDFRIRLSSIDPEDLSAELIDKFAKSKKLCRHFHIPLQSGDDRILKKMNRRYSSSEAMELVAAIKGRVSGAAVTLDVIVGFPGETEENFKNTLKAVAEAAPLRMHIFPYSRRAGTKAAEYADVAAPGVVADRIGRLKEIQDRASYDFRRRFVGQRLEVLTETRRDKNTGLLTGYSDNYIKVVFNGPDTLMRGLIRVKILEVSQDLTLGGLNGD